MKKRRDRGPSDRGNNEEEGRPGERDVSRNARHLGLAFVERRACMYALVLGQWNKELSAAASLLFLYLRPSSAMNSRIKATIISSSIGRQLWEEH